MNAKRQGALYVNGRLSSEDEPSVSALDRGFTLGDGVFETMRAPRGRIFRLAQHLARLRMGAAVLALALPLDEELAAGLQRALAHLGEAPAIMRLTVTRGIDKGRGIGLPTSSTPTVAIRATPASKRSSEAAVKGYRARISPIRRNETSPLSRIKSCNYGDSVLARLEAQRLGCDEAILLNGRGEVACATTANVFAVKSDKLWTAPVESGVLPGITRACILELAATLRVDSSAAPFDRDFLLHADECFLTNSASGVVPVTEIDGRAVGSGHPGPATRELAASYERLIETELRT